MGILNSDNNLNASDKIFIEEDEGMAAILEQSIIDHYSKSTRTLGGNVHVSSLTYCLRKEVCKSIALNTGKMKPTDFISIFSAMAFTRGLVSEYLLTKVLGEEIDAQKDLQYNGILAHPDAVTREGEEGAIIEMKNTNSYMGITLGDESLKSYIRQTATYMVMSGLSLGYIIVVYGLPHSLEWVMSTNGIATYKVENYQKKGVRPFKVFRLNLNRHSKLRDQIKEGLDMTHKHINSFEYNDESILVNFPRLDEFNSDISKCGWKCKSCEVRDLCKKVEPNPELDSKLTKVLLNKLIDDNVVNIKKD